MVFINWNPQNSIISVFITYALPLLFKGENKFIDKPA